MQQREFRCRPQRRIDVTQHDQSKLTNLMVFLGIFIGGMVERSIYPNAEFEGLQMAKIMSNNYTIGRRYCDPPNVTIFALYESYDESKEDADARASDINFSEVEEMDFEAILSPEQEESHHQWLLFRLGSILSPVITAPLASKFSAGRLFGVSPLSAVLLGLIVPTGSSVGEAIVITIQGIAQGCILPSALLMALNATKESRRLQCLALLSGGGLGFGGSELVPSNLRVFTASILGVTWFATWVLMVRTQKATPQDQSIPWKKIVSSRVVWMSALVIFGFEGLQYTNLYIFRQYLDFVYNYSNRYMFFISQLLAAAFAAICAFASDQLQRRDIVSRTTSRRIFVYISHFIPSGLLFLACFVGCDLAPPVALFSMCVIAGGAAYAGCYPSILDISPNFAPVVVAFTCTCGAVARTLPILITKLIFKGMMPGSWRLAMSISSLIGLTSAIFFMLRGSSRPPSWNYPNIPKHVKPSQKITLERCILSVVAVSETESFRARACSTSVSPKIKNRLTDLKRASIS